MPRESCSSRRKFIGCMGALVLSQPWRPARANGVSTSPADQLTLPFPVVDFHVHLDNSSIDQVLPLSKERNVKFGVVEHAGTKENIYPVVLSNDDELKEYLRKLEGKGVYKGIQTEWSDWMGCFSRKALSQLDYILTDAMTFPGKGGKRIKLWEPQAEQQVEMEDRDRFMDRLVDWNVQILSTQPIDVLANVSWLPARLAGEYDRFWTDRRISQVIDAAVKHRVALEISSGFKLPNLRFLRVAKQAGIRFTFGSNGRYPNMGLLEYSLSMAQQLRLTEDDLFRPAPEGQKAIQRWKR